MLIYKYLSKEMNKVEYRFDKIPSKSELKNIYLSCGWSEYLKDEERFVDAIKSSSVLITVWDDKKLVGLLRALSDFDYVIYIQDILLLPRFQNRGIGSRLIRLVEEKYPKVRQIILIADNNGRLDEFYSRNKYDKLRDYSINGYVKFR